LGGQHAPFWGGHFTPELGGQHQRVFQLIEEAKKGAKNHELSKVVLEVFNENQQSYTYFKSIGFNNMIQRMVLKI
jgi:hypothetical protein